MRTLLLLHGISGSGKSSFISKHNLEPFTLSVQNLSMALRSIELTESDSTVMRKEDSDLKDLILNILERRMAEGLFTIIDGNNETTVECEPYVELAQRYNYRVCWMDFPQTLENCISYNLKRDEYLRVSEESIRSSFNVIEDLPYEKVTDIYKLLDNPEPDVLDEYKGVVVIGDIHSCGYTLKSIIAKYGKDYKIVLLGDYFDRGDKPYETFLILDYLTRQDNVTAVIGNHDMILLDYMNDKRMNYTSTMITCMELANRDISRSKIRSLYNRFRDYYLFEFAGKEYLCTHAGLPYYPDSLIKVSTRQMVNSVYELAGDIDMVYKENYIDGNPIQIHGHIPTESNEYSFSLDGGVERGGSLLYAVIDTDGLRIEEVDNKRMEE